MKGQEDEGGLQIVLLTTYHQDDQIKGHNQVGHVAPKAETDVKLIVERYETENLFEDKSVDR